MRYENFVIQITTGESDRVVLRVSESPVGESAAVVAESGGPLCRLLEHSRAGELDQLIAEGGPQRLGQRLYDALVCGPIQRRFLEAVGRSGSGDAQGLRIKLQVDFETLASAEVHALPWEYLYRAETGSFLALDRRFAVVRHLRLPVSRHLPAAPRRLKLLVAVAVPRDRQPLETEEECRRIAASWRDDDAMEISFMAHATLDRLRDRLLAEEYHGLHFIGHAQIEAASGDGQLLLEDDRGEVAPCTGRDLAIQLSDRTSLRWVFLDACSTGSSSTRRPFGGLASALLRTGVPAVLAMQRPVSDRAAVAFSHMVYRRLAAGDGIDTAVSEGRLAIHRHLPASPEWGTPVLFLRSAGGELFQRQRSKPRLEATPTSLPGLSPSAGTPAVKPRGRWWLLGPALLLTGFVAVNTLDLSRLRRPAAGPDPARPDTAANGVETFGDEGVQVALITVREGEVVAIPAFGARASVTFDDSLGTSFARLTVSLPGEAEAASKPFMGPATMTLGQGRSLMVQSIDWSRRSILILPVRSD